MKKDTSELTNRFQLPTAEVAARKVAITKEMDQIMKSHVPGQEMDDEILDRYLILEHESDALNAQFDFSNQRYMLNGKVGLKDFTGEILIPAIYNDFTDVSCYDMKGEFIGASNETGKFALVKMDGKGTVVSPFEFDGIVRCFCMPFYMVFKDDKFGLYSWSGKFVAPCELDHVYEPHSDVVTLEAGGKLGIVTTDGLYVRPEFDEVDVNNDCLYVRKGKTWGFLDVHGKFIDEDDQEGLDSSELLAYYP